MAEAEVNIEALYSDHPGQLVLLVDAVERGRAVSLAWERERQQREATRGRGPSA